MNVDADVARQLEAARHELGAAHAEAVAARAEASDARDQLLTAHAQSAAAHAQLAAAQDDLAESRVELARRIRVEAALREIATRLTALRDPAEVLQRAVDAAAALLAADGARIDLLDERDGGLYWGYDATTGNRPGLGPIDGDGAAEPGEGISGRAFVLRRSVWTGDYLKDDRFTHAAAPDGFAESNAIRSALATPIISEGAVLGTLTVYSDQRDAYGPPEAELIGILADQASLAITNARLIERLNRSSDDLARQAEVERALREITAEISAVR